MTTFENSYCTSVVSLHISRVGKCQYRIPKSHVHIGSAPCLGCIGQTNKQKEGSQPAMSGLWYLLYLLERSDKNVIAVRLLIVALHLNVHAVINQHWHECGTCYTGIVQTWFIWLNEHPERKLSISSVRNAASGIFNGTIR